MTGIFVKRSGPRRWWQRLARWLLILPVALVVVSVLPVAVLRFVDPPFTAFMLDRKIEGWRQGNGVAIDYRWRDFDRIAPTLALAVIASEDQNFSRHGGFDLQAIRQARAEQAAGGRVRGASTISQQVAKNLFLWSGRSWLRKGLEAWFTVLIEWLWPKQRILEVYVNIAEFGDGVYGAEAAAQRFYGRPAAQLTTTQSARLAAVLPSPRRYSAVDPGPYVVRRTQAIERQMRFIGGVEHLQALD